jgi:hypothetical protein
MFHDPGDVPASRVSIDFRCCIDAAEYERNLPIDVEPAHVLLGIVIVEINQIRFPGIDEVSGFFSLLFLPFLGALSA